MTQVNKRKRRGKKAGSCCSGIETLFEPRFFKALCDPNRIALLLRLARCGEPCSVGQLNACCPVDLSVVSRHLAALREAGILKAEKRGKEVYYSVRAAELIGKLRALADAVENCCPSPGGDEVNVGGSSTHGAA